jgi:hypothetical protein
VAISCVSEGACIFEGGGTFIEIRGRDAHVRISGLVFRNASTSAVAVEKKSGEGNGSVLEQMICECTFSG